MIYFLIDPTDTKDPLTKIGHCQSPELVVKRLSTHQSSNVRWVFYCAIEGERTHEALIHDHFSKYLAAGDRSRETFHLAGDLKDYVQWLGRQAWAACSIEEVLDPYGHFTADVMWPNQERNGYHMRQRGLFDQTIGPITAPLSAEERKSLFIRDSNEWYTPAEYVESARRVMGAIDLDPATSPFANTIVRAAHIYTKAHDGLTEAWRGRVWLNPPYGGQQVQFIEKLLAEHATGSVTEAVLCVNGYRYDTIWFRPLWQFPICFCARRVKFLGGASGTGPKTEDDNNPSNGTVFAYLGRNKERFANEFSKHGFVVRQVEPWKEETT